MLHQRYLLLDDFAHLEDLVNVLELYTEVRVVRIERMADQIAIPRFSAVCSCIKDARART